MESKAGPILSVTGMLIMWAYVVSLPVFYGIFAFGSYEDWDCFASSDHEVKEPWIDDGGKVPEDYINVSNKFYMVNLWGFINFMVPVGFGCFALCFMKSFRKRTFKEIFLTTFVYSMLLTGLSYIS